MGTPPKIDIGHIVPRVQLPRAGILYLCRDDFDAEALESLVRLRYGGELTVIVHDDSRYPESRAQVNLAVWSLIERYPSRRFLLLRRPDRGAVRPGALGYVLDRTRHLHDLLLICDSRSSVKDAGLLEKAATRLILDPSVAGVQCRTVPDTGPGNRPVKPPLRLAMLAMHTLMLVQARCRAVPFTGRSALLRTRVVREAAGPGQACNSGDTCQTIRLDLSGSPIVYAPGLVFSRNGPSGDPAGLMRELRWASDCASVLLEHSRAALAGGRMPISRRIGIFILNRCFRMQAHLLERLRQRFSPGRFAGSGRVHPGNYRCVPYVAE